MLCSQLRQVVNKADASLRYLSFITLPFTYLHIYCSCYRQGIIPLPCFWDRGQHSAFLYGYTESLGPCALPQIVLGHNYSEVFWMRLQMNFQDRWTLSNTAASGTVLLYQLWHQTSTCLLSPPPPPSVITWVNSSLLFNGFEPPSATLRLDHLPDSRSLHSDCSATNSSVLYPVLCSEKKTPTLPQRAVLLCPFYWELPVQLEAPSSACRLAVLWQPLVHGIAGRTPSTQVAAHLPRYATDRLVWLARCTCR